METEMIKYQGIESVKPTRAQLYRLLTEVKGRLRTYPEDYNQFNFCGTACCIGGTMFTLVTGEPTYTQIGTKVAEFSVWCLGEDWEPVSFTLPWLLMEPRTGWPEELARAYTYAQTPAQRAEVGCKAIDRWIEEKGIGPGPGMETRS